MMSALQLPGLLVDATWLHAHLQHPQLIIFDASWHLPGTGRDARAEWVLERIAQARFFDFDQRICDQSSALPHMLPTASQFTDQLQNLGLNHDSIVVIYDSLGVFSSPRAWWMLRAMGFDQCALLNGGLPHWHRAGYKTVRAEPSDSVARGNFIANRIAHRISDRQQLVDALDQDSAAIIDARPSARFRGDVEEPRPGLRKGHIPGAHNLPFSSLLEDGCMKAEPALSALLADHLGKDRQTIVSCGSGVTACIVAFAAELAGFAPLSVYDGSWAEWGQPGALPVVLDE